MYILVRIATEEKEIEEIRYYIALAAAVANNEENQPKCTKSRRGVVIVKDENVIGKGWNMPTLEELTCSPVCVGENNHSDSGYDDCSAIHAEKMAIIDAYKNISERLVKACVLFKGKSSEKPQDAHSLVYSLTNEDWTPKKNPLEGARLYHIKVKDGKPVESGEPSCRDCSKTILISGISEVVLLEKDGYHIYTAEEFNKLSFEHHMKK